MRGLFLAVIGVAGALGAAAAGIGAGSGCGGGSNGGGGPGTPMPDLTLAAAADLGPVENDGGGFNTTCGPAKGVTSSCDDPKSIIRVMARLGVGVAAAEGELVVFMNHYRLGNGANGGVGHTLATKAGVKLGAGKMAQLDLDMCAGGDMWSEENCEFWLYGFIDGNGNRELEAGEPAGHVVFDVSCYSDESPCVGITLTCTDGPSCVAFDDPGGCECRDPGCGSSIVTCQ